MLCGLLVADAGAGTCIGLDIIREAPLIRQHVGYMTQNFSLYEDLTVFENLDFVASVYRNAAIAAQAINAIIDRMGLADRRDQLAGQLSGGWKQRLALAACVMHRPKLLLLDEPTSGVDALARRQFWDLISDMAGEGLTVLVSTHYMDEAERCKRIVYLANGRIVVQGSAEEVTRNRASSRSRRPAPASTAPRASCARPPASRRRRCSGACCMSPGPTARRWPAPSRRSAAPCDGSRSSLGSKTRSSIC